jgi:DNA-binding MarR family transcriptional regulator
VASPSPRQWRHAVHDERIAHLIKNAFRGTSGALQRRLREHSLLYGHWTLLRILWQSDGMTQRQLSEQAGVKESSTFTALQAMAKLGYVKRRRIASNARQVRIFLTARGAALRSRIVPMAQEVNRIALKGVSAKDLAATRRTLLRVIENLGSDAW